MMEKISIFNYEAFYLDYLEGNLNEEDTRSLMAFLEAHPECKMDESLDLSPLPVVEEATYSGKSDLYMVDEKGPIDLSNVEFFMIAASENELSQAKQLELMAFIDANSLQERFAGFQSVYFEADQNLTYANKAALKQEARIVAPMWYWVAAAAAVIVFVFLVVLPASSPFEEKQHISKKEDAQKEVNPEPQEQNNDDLEQEEGALPQFVPSLEKPRNIAQKQDGSRKNKRDQQDVEGLNTQRAGIISVGNMNDELRPISPSLVQEPKQDDRIMAKNNSDMYNPIEPITSAIANKTNTQVDFQKTKAESERKGFKFKVGKFEVSHISRKP